MRWRTIQKFIARELAKEGRPKHLQAALMVVQHALDAFLSLRNFLEDPENKGMRACQHCEQDFISEDRWDLACSDECQLKYWSQYPQLPIDEQTADAILFLVQQMEEAQEKTQP
jgi:hypothetical protein